MLTDLMGPSGRVRNQGNRKIAFTVKNSMVIRCRQVGRNRIPMEKNPGFAYSCDCPGYGMRLIGAIRPDC